MTRLVKTNAPVSLCVSHETSPDGRSHAVKVAPTTTHWRPTMAKLRFYRAYSRLPVFGYAGKAIALAALAAGFPLAAAAAFTFAPDAISTPVAAQVLLLGAAALSFMLLAALTAYLRSVAAAAA